MRRQQVIGAHWARTMRAKQPSSSIIARSASLAQFSSTPSTLQGLHSSDGVPPSIGAEAALPPLRPITALYGQRLYRLDTIASMATLTLFDKAPEASTDGGSAAASPSSTNGSGTSLADGAEATSTSSAATDAEALKKSLRAKRRHVNKYMNPELAAQREEDVRQLRQAIERDGASGPMNSASPSARRPVLTVRPVLSFPMLRGPTRHSNQQQQQIANDARRGSNPFPLAPKSPEMVILEVSELDAVTAAAEATGGKSQTTASTPAAVVKETHHVAVFSDGTVVSFGLSDDHLRRLRSEALDPHSDGAKDVLLTADTEVIRLAERTNLCVFPALDGDEASALAALGLSAPPASSTTANANGSTHPTPTPGAPPPQTHSTLRGARPPKAKSLFPSSAATIHRIARNSVGTDIALRYRFTTAGALVRAELPPQGTVNSVPASPGGVDLLTFGSAAAVAAKAAGGSYIDDTRLEAVVLSDNSAAALLPFALCFFELIQLRALNALAYPIHRQVAHWQAHVADRGTLPMTLKAARLLKAKAMRIASRHAKGTARRHRLLWEDHHAAHREAFEEAAEHFELSARSDAFRRRTEGAQASLAYLCDQAHGQKDVVLEWVIIVLIAVEVYIAMKAHAHDFDDDGDRDGHNNKNANASSLSSSFGNPDALVVAV